MYGAAAAMVGGALIGQVQANADSNRARAAQRAALEQLQNVYSPSTEEMSADLDKYSYQGDFNPYQEQAIQQGQTELGNVSVDPRLRQAQMDALATMSRINAGGGMTDIERAELSKMTADTENMASQQGSALREEFARRGMSGGAMEMAQRQQANEEAINRQAEGTSNIAAQAQARALQALQAQAGLGASIEDREYGQQKNMSSAQDIINNFNSQTRQGVQTRNTGNLNQYGYQNLENRGTVANKNVDISNDQKLQNIGAKQQRFDNELSKATGTAGQYNKKAEDDLARAQATRTMWTGIGQGAGTAIAGSKK